MAARMLRGYVGGLMLLALLAGASFAQAQADAPRGRGRGPALVVEQIGLALEGLNLTFDQRLKIDQILTEARTQARGMARELAQADPPTRRGRARALMIELRDKIIPILTADQARSFNLRLQDLRFLPENEPGAPALQRPVGQVVEQLYDVVGKLQLEPEQKTKVDALFDDTRQKMAALRQNPPGDGTAPQRIAQMVQVLRDELSGILTETQQEQLRVLIAQSGAEPAPEPVARGRAGRGRGRGRAGRAMLPDTTMQPNMADGMMAGGATPSVARPATPEPADLPGVPIGQHAPDFTLNTIDNRPLSLSAFKGKVVLLVFGSYSSPSFRQRAPGIEQIRNAYGSRLNVIVVYTKESHAAGEWEIDRNKEDGISVAQPTELSARIAQAKDARTTLRLTAPFVVDTLDNATATTYGGFTNAAILIGRDGTVLHRQKWFEPYAIRRYIDDALK